MLKRIGFAGLLGLAFGLLMTLLLPMPEGIPVIAVGSFIIGWFADDIRKVVFKVQS